ncbi:DNA polymerase III subunit delta, partial [candidate division WOR-3 bacterium]|nr:DNA polymerase III subunit delta [candidate division WOR-3 bacterium]
MPEHPSSKTGRRATRQADRFRPVYVLLGDDGRAADEFIRELRKSLVAPGFEAFDFEEFHAEDVPVREALQRLRQAPVGSLRRLVVIRAAEGLSRAGFEEVCSGLASLPAEGSTAVLTCTWSRNVADVIAGAGLGRFVVNLKPPRGRELVARIRSWAARLGFAVEPDAVELLVELAGDDTTLLWGELEKLATAVEPGARVDAALVRQLAGRSRDFELNEYVDSLGRGNLPRALEVLARL